MKKMSKKVAALESKADHLETELTYIHGLLVQCGFPEGIKTLKETAEELISEIAISQE